MNTNSRLSFALKTNVLQILQYFFSNFFIFSHWPLIFDIIKFNTSLYRFLLKCFIFESNYSIAFLVSCKLYTLQDDADGLKNI